MIRLAIPILILLLLLTGAVWALRGFKLPQFALSPAEHETVQKEQPDAALSSASKPSAKQAAAPGTPSNTDQNASFDIARIDPSGISVFAGRADPGSRVTVMGDGQALGTAEADENGEWTLSAEHQFADSDPELALVTKSAAEALAEEAKEKEKEKAAAEQPTQERPPAEAQADARGSSAASAVTSQLLKNFEGMVEDARTEMQAKEELAASSPDDIAQEPDDIAEAEVKAEVEVEPEAEADVEPGVDVSASDATASESTLAAMQIEPKPRKSVPLPIMFVFNEANMTDQGRKAASLLLEYLQLKHFNGVTLTGHADERGTDALNMSLSRERLEAVARFLKAGGYEGQLTLIPKGESEPFLGVKRDEYSQEDLYQLDRRVELVISP